MPKLSDMVGRTFLYRTENYVVRGVRSREDGVHVLTTDKGELNLTSRQLMDMLPVEEDGPPRLMLQLTTDDSRDIKELSDMVMAGIRKVQTDVNYVPQAQAINDGAKVVIGIKRLILDAVKLSREITQ